MPISGRSYGLLVESFDGRPIKIEGNPKHPGTRGAATAIAQGSILGMYDPDRSREVLEGGKQTTWEAFNKAAGELADDGAAVRILSGIVSSPTFAGLPDQLLTKM